MVWPPKLPGWPPKLPGWTPKLPVWTLKLPVWTPKLPVWTPKLPGWTSKLPAWRLNPPARTTHSPELFFQELGEEHSVSNRRHKPKKVLPRRHWLPPRRDGYNPAAFDSLRFFHRQIPCPRFFRF